MRADFHHQGNEGRLYLSTERVNWQFGDEDSIRWEGNFARNIPLAINIKSAASNIELDLSELGVTEL